MKMKWSIFTLCCLFSGSVMAESVPVDTTGSALAVKSRHRRKRKAVHAPAVTPAKASSAVAPTQPPTNAAEAKAPDAKTDTFQAWLEGIKRRLGKSEVRSNKLVSVAAVRGDEVSDAAPLYWKGKRMETKAAPPEQKDFEAAIDTALTGDKVAAKERLQSFLLAYPKSSFASDAKETLARLEN